MATQKEGSTSSKKEASKDNNSQIKALQEFPPIIHLGKLKKKQSRKLRRGKDISGINKIQSAVAQVMATVDEENAIPIVISYEQKPKRRKKVRSVKVNGWKVNRKKVKKRLKKNGLTHPWL